MNLYKIITDFSRPGRPKQADHTYLDLVETEANGTYGIQMKGVLPWLVRWARRAGTRDFYPGLDALISPVLVLWIRDIWYGSGTT